MADPFYSAEYRDAHELSDHDLNKSPPVAIFFLLAAGQKTQQFQLVKANVWSKSVIERFNGHVLLPRCVYLLKKTLKVINSLSWL